MVKDPDVEDGARVVVEATIQAPSHGGYALGFKGSKIAMDQRESCRRSRRRITPWWNRPCPLSPHVQPLRLDDSVRHPHRVDRHRKHGRAMCQHLLQAGYRVTLFTRNRTKAVPILTKGATWADSPHAGPAHGCALHDGRPPRCAGSLFRKRWRAGGIATGMIVIDMTTTEPSSPATSRKRRKPVRPTPSMRRSPGDVGACLQRHPLHHDRGTAHAAGCHAAVRASGKKMVHQGGPGAGQHTKLCNQIVIAAPWSGVKASLTDIEPSSMCRMHVESIRGGAAACWTLDNLAPRIVDRNFDPVFRGPLREDMGIALEEAGADNSPPPGLAHQLYQRVQALGHGCPAPTHSCWPWKIYHATLCPHLLPHANRRRDMNAVAWPSF